MGYLIVPSILAITLKLFIVLKHRLPAVNAGTHFWLLFVGFLGVNIFELVAFYYLFKNTPESGYWALVGYYVFIIWAIYAMCAIAVSAFFTSKLVDVVIFGMAILLALGFLIPDFILSGVASIGYSLTRVAGPYYFLAQVGLAAPLMFTCVLLAFSFFKATQSYCKRDLVVISVAFAPFILLALLVIALMAAGYKFNGSVVLSLAICFTLWVLIQASNEFNLFLLLSHIPTTTEYKLTREFVKIMSDPSVGVNNATEFIEQELIKKAMQLTGGHKAQAADLVGLTRQTFQRRVEKYSLKN